MSEKILCSVCIATYKRPLLLKELLKSLLIQKEIDLNLIEILIIDNDINQSAKRIFNEFHGKGLLNISYHNQPLQNISLTRNIGLEKAKGKYIAIIDDDETADPYLLSNLINTAYKYNADAVFGYVEAVFPENAPKWIKQREIYFKPMGKTGDEPYFRYTTNCLINAEFIRKYNIRFDPEYGLSGGEDGFFFDEMYKHNAKFVVCREAISYEVVPDYRTKLSFIYQRFFQRGNNYSINYIKTSDNRFYKAWFYLLLRSIAALIIYGFLVVLSLPIKKIWIFNFVDFSLNLGKIAGLFGIKKELYRHEIKKFKGQNS